MTKYRIYVGLNHKHTMEPVTSKTMAQITISNILKVYGIDGATLYNAIGVWEGTKEPTIIIEIVDTENDIDKELIQDFCNEIKELLYQDCVMVEKINANVDFI